MSFQNVLRIEFDEETGALRLAVTRDAFAWFIISRTISREEIRMQELLRSRATKCLELEAFIAAVHRVHIIMVEAAWAKWLVECERPMWNYQPCEALALMPHGDRMSFEWDHYCGHMSAAGMLIIRMANGSTVPGIPRYYLRTFVPGIHRLETIRVEEDTVLFMRVLIARAIDPTTSRRVVAALCDALQHLLTLGLKEVRDRANIQYRAVLRYLIEERLTELH
jgi:hypothetical protein